MSGEPDTTEQTVGSSDLVVTDEQRAYWAQLEAPMASCAALITDADGRILVVDPTYKDGFDLPGGMVQANETQIEGLARELAEELDLTGVPIGRCLVLDQVPAARYGRAMVVTVYHIGPLTDQQTQSLRFADGEIGSAEFLSVEEALARLPHCLARRIKAAHAALLAGAPARSDRWQGSRPVSRNVRWAANVGWTSQDVPGSDFLCDERLVRSPSAKPAGWTED